MGPLHVLGSISGHFFNIRHLSDYLFVVFDVSYLGSRARSRFNGVRGLENITFALEDPLMWTSLHNTIWLAVASGVPQHLVAIPLAYLINEYLGRYRDVAMGAYFVPYITSTVAISIMFTTLFSTDYGAVNAALQGLAGWEPLSLILPAENIDWLGRPETVKPVLAFVVFWRYVGFNTILYVAALQSIPKDLYEAARIDGAKEFKIFWFITLPR